MLTQTTQGHSIESEGVRHVGAFTMVQDQHMFHLLSSGLYTRKEEAPIREIVSNGDDAHRRAGQTRPLIVTLPTKEDPRFMVQDFGAGMSRQTLHEQYPSYGWSDKRGVAVERGGFGLGCKAPVAYLTKGQPLAPKPFTVESVHNGLLNIIVCALDEHRIPIVMALAEDEPTDRPSGTTVHFVVENEDMAKFATITGQILHYFKNKPELVNMTMPTVDELDFGNVKKVRNPEGLLKGARIVISGISYPVNDVFMKGDPQLLAWVRDGIHVYRDEGPRVMSPSREALEITNESIDFVYTAFREEALKMHLHVLQLLRAQPGKTLFQRLVTFRRELVSQQREGLHYSAEYFLAVGATQEELTFCLPATAVKYQPSLALPEQFLGKEAGVKLYHYTPRFKPVGGGSFLYELDSLTITEEGTYAPMLSAAEKRRQRNSPKERPIFRLPVFRGNDATSGVRIVIADDSKTARRIKSLMFPEMEAFHQKYTEAKAAGGEIGEAFSYPATLVAVPCYRVSVAHVQALAEAAKANYGYEQADIILASSIPIIESLQTPAERAAKGCEKAKFALRGKQELFISLAQEQLKPVNLHSHRYLEIEPKVALISPDALSRERLAAVYQTVSGLSWRHAKATSFTLSHWASSPDGENCSAKKIEVAFNMLGAKRPGIVWATNQGVAGSCEAAGMMTLEQCLLETLQEYLAGKPALLKDIAWQLSIQGKTCDRFGNDNPAGRYIGSFRQDSSEIYAFYESVKDTRGGRGILKVLPNLADAEAPKFIKKEVQELKLVFDYFSLMGWEKEKVLLLNRDGTPQSFNASNRQVQNVRNFLEYSCPEFTSILRQASQSLYQESGLTLMRALMRDPDLSPVEPATST